MYGLRELERRDLPAINRWRNNPELIVFLGAPFRFINIDVDEKWFDRYMANRGNQVRCAITDGENDEVIGLISLTGIDFINRCASLHIMIGDCENQGKGIGTFAVHKMLEHAFWNMNLERVELNVLKDNSRAIGLYEKVGFVREGIRRRAAYKSGRYVDMYVYSVLKEEYMEKFAGGDCPKTQIV